MIKDTNNIEVKAGDRVSFEIDFGFGNQIVIADIVDEDNILMAVSPAGKKQLELLPPCTKITNASG